jgi:hypothetical protein
MAGQPTRSALARTTKLMDSGTRVGADTELDLTPTSLYLFRG